MGSTSGQNKFSTKEENEMYFNVIYSTTIKTATDLAKSINKVLRDTIGADMIQDYLELLNSEFIFASIQFRKSYKELELILKNYRLSVTGNPKALAIIYAHFRIVESYSNFQKAKDNFAVTKDQKNLIMSLRIVRRQIRAIYVCKY